MGLFRSRQKSSQEPPAGRRRPLRSGEGAAPVPMAQAFSYHSQRSAATENVGRRDLRAAAGAADREAAPDTGRRGRAIHIGALVALIPVVGYTLYLQPEPRIVLQSDKASTHFLQDQSVYREAVTQTLGGSPLNRIKPLADTSAVEAGLQQSYPEINTVAVHLPLLQTRPEVVIKPHEPAFILTTTAGTAFLIDGSGRALASASQISNSAELGILTLHDKTGLAVKLGNRALPGSTVSFARTVVAALTAKGLDPTALSLTTAYQLDVTVTGDPYFIKFNTQEDALQQAGTYLATRDRLARDKVAPREYLDVRVLGRVYYK